MSLPGVSTSSRAVLCFFFVSVFYSFGGFTSWPLLWIFWWCPNKGQGESAKKNYAGLPNASVADFLWTTLRKYTFVFCCGNYKLAKTCAHWPINGTQVVHFLFLRLFAEFCARFAFFCARFAQHFGTIPGSFWPMSVDHWPEIVKQLIASYQLSTSATIQNRSVS